MRQSSLLAAALMAFALLGAPAASAFEFDAQGSSNADGSPKFTDPDENLNLGDGKTDQKFDQKTGPAATTNTMMIAPGLFLSGSASNSNSNGAGAGYAEDWQNPKPGRLTH